MGRDRKVPLGSGRLKDLATTLSKKEALRGKVFKAPGVASGTEKECEFSEFFSFSSFFPVKVRLRDKAVYLLYLSRDLCFRIYFCPLWLVIKAT